MTDRWLWTIKWSCHGMKKEAGTKERGEEKQSCIYIYRQERKRSQISSNPSDLLPRDFSTSLALMLPFHLRVCASLFCFLPNPFPHPQKKGSPSASRGLQCPPGSHGIGEEALKAYCRRIRPSTHKSHADPTSLGSQEKGRNKRNAPT